MNQLPGAEAFVRMLQKHSVAHVFGLCGDTSLPLYDALHRLDHGIVHILTRDERSAAYMADGYARAAGRPGTTLVVPGPGVYNAGAALATAHAACFSMALSGALGRAGHPPTKVETTAKGVSLGAGKNGLLDADGSALVVHERADDYKSDPAGNAGSRIACGVIRR